MKRRISFFLLITFIMAAVFIPIQATAAGFDNTLTPLKDIYKDYFLIGTVFSPHSFSGVNYDVITHHFNALTAENAMKPDAMQKVKGAFTFTQVDSALEKIEAEGIKLHGHTLAWHNQSPAWMNGGLERAAAEQNLLEHVNGVAGHYAGKLISWDVLNEAVDDSANAADWKASLRKTEWYNAFSRGGNGYEYIDFLFRAAREADPDAVLYYNDYNLNNSNKAGAVAAMVKEINDAYLAEGNTRLLIEGVGMQGHYSTNTSISSVEDSIKLFKELGVVVSISELDVTVSGAGGSGLSEEDEIRQGIVYAQLFELFKKYSDTIERVTLWGVDDMSSWRKENFPLLFNADFSAKQAYYAVADPEKYLEEHNATGGEGVAQPQAKVYFGTPVIDGEIDEIWNTAETLQVNQMIQAWQTSSGKARVLWDTEYLYVLFEVTDATPNHNSFNPHECDSVEVFVDEENCKKGAYAADDGQYRASSKGWFTFGDTTNSEGFEAVSIEGSNSYVVEMKIPFKAVTPQNGTVIGFDLQINDAENGTRKGVAKWNDATDDSWHNTSKWGEAVLLQDANSAPPEETGAESGNDDSGSTVNDNSGNPYVTIGIVVGIVAVVGAIAYLFMKNKNKKQ